MIADLPGAPGSRSTIRSQNHAIVSNPEGNTTFAFPPGFPLKTNYDEDADDFLTFEGGFFVSSVLPQTVLWGPYVYPLPDGTQTTGGADATTGAIWPPGHGAHFFARGDARSSTPATAATDQRAARAIP